MFLHTPPYWGPFHKRWAETQHTYDLCVSEKMVKNCIARIRYRTTIQNNNTATKSSVKPPILGTPVRRFGTALKMPFCIVLFWFGNEIA